MVFFAIEKLAFLINKMNVDVYDYDFRNYFDCHSIINSSPCPVVLRIGPIADYDSIYDRLRDLGMKLLVSKEEQEKVSKLENWYPLISELTPFTKIYDQLPEVEDLLKDFSFPVFIKGNRQTNHHLRSKSIIDNRDMYEKLRIEWKTDSYLYWQKAAIREFISLLPVNHTLFPDMVPFSFEFRVFVWKNQMIGYGQYWCLAGEYQANKKDDQQIHELVGRAVRRIDSIFFSVDVAKTMTGEWIIIEVNDGQESGYQGAHPYQLWARILEMER